MPTLRVQVASHVAFRARLSQPVEQVAPMVEGSRRVALAALDCFLRTQMDVLVLGDTVIERLAK
jgi:hypothetical protein